MTRVVEILFISLEIDRQTKCSSSTNSWRRCLLGHLRASVSLIGKTKGCSLQFVLLYHFPQMKGLLPCTVRLIRFNQDRKAFDSQSRLIKGKAGMKCQIEFSHEITQDNGSDSQNAFPGPCCGGRSS